MIKTYSLKMFLTGFYFIIICFSSIAEAAFWYVDSSATGSNDGKSWYNAWKSFGNIVGTNSGDTIIVSGGTSSKTYNEQLSPLDGITIRPAAAEAAPSSTHSGTVIINSPTPYGIQIRGHNVTVDGLTNGVRKIKIIGADRGVDVGSGNTGALIRGVEVVGSNNVGIMFYMGFGEIDNCYIHSMGPNADAAVRGLYTTHATDYGRLIVHDSIIVTPQRGSGFGADGIQTTNGLIAYNNHIKAVYDAAYTGTQHEDAIQQTGSNYIKIYNNTISGYSNYGIYIESSKEHIQIYNNYIYNTRGAITKGGKSSNNHLDINISNNIIVDSIIGTPSIYFAKNELATYSDTSIRNNLLVNSPDGIQVGIGNFICGKDVVIDYNIGPYITCKGLIYTQPSYSSTSIPKFIRYSKGAGEANDLNLLATDTIARGKGINLSAYFIIDHNNNYRPIDSSWNIGAYESKYVGPNYPLKLQIK